MKERKNLYQKTDKLGVNFFDIALKFQILYSGD